MKKNFTQLIPAFSAPWSCPELKATFLFLLLVWCQTAWAQSPTINTTNSLNPSCAAVDRSFELTINGTNFDASAVVKITGTAFAGDVFLTPKSRTVTQLKVDIPGTSAVLDNPGTLTIAVRQTQGGTDVLSNAVQMPVYPNAATIAGPATVCVNAAANFSVPALDHPATYTWSVVSGAASITAGGATPTAEVSFGNTAGTVRIALTIQPACSIPAITATYDVAVNALPAVTLAPFNNICSNASVLTLSGGAPAGGTYTVDGVVATTFDPKTAALGLHEIIYYYTQNGCTGSARQNINVVSAPSATLAAIGNICSNAAAFTLSGGAPAGGTYTVDGVTATTFNPATAGVGTHTIAYTVTQNGCTSTASEDITILQAPTASLDPFAAVCSNAAAFTLSGGFPAGGTYAVNGVTATAFNPASVGAGTHTITYTVTQNGCTSLASENIIVLQAPAVSLAPLTNVCADAAAFTLSGGLPAGGTYAVNGTAATTFDPVAAGVGTHTITYTVTQNGCENTATRTITVVSPPPVNISAPIGTQSCQGGTIPLTVTNTPGAAYQWFLDGSPLAGATTQNLNATKSGNYSVQVTNNGCAVTSAIVEVIILDPASIITEGPSVQLCTPQSTILHAVTGYNSYQWYKDNTLLSGETNPTLAVNQTGDYYVVVNTSIGSCRTVTSAVTRVEVASPITNNTITTADQSVCSGSTITIVAPAAAGGNGNFTYQWQLSLNNGPFTDITTAGNGEQYTYQTGTVTQNTVVAFRRMVTSGACTSTTAAVTLTVNPEIADNILNNSNTRNICVGESVNLVASVPTGGAGAITYQWQESTDNVNFSNISGANARNYNYVAGSLAGTRYFRRVVTSGGCTSTTGSVAVNVNPAITDNNISPNRNPICPGTSVVIQGPVPTGGNGTNYRYQWQSSTDNVTFADITGATTRNYNYSAGAFAGTIYFKRVVTSGGCDNTSSAVALKVNPPIVGNDTITTRDRSLCTGTSLIIEAPVATGGVDIRYKWQSSPDNVNFTDVTTFNANNQNYLYSPGNFTGDIYFRRVVNADGCTDFSSKSVRITVQQTSTYTLILNVNPFPVCGQAVYTARVYRDVTSVSYPNNPQYSQVTVNGGTDVTSQFTFDWWKNDADPIAGNNSSQITLPGPQSRDYYTVRARPSNVVPTCFLYNNRPDFIPADRGINVLFSNRIYRGAPFGYAVNIASSAQPGNAICQGTGVTFTATPSSSSFVNPRYQWQVNGVNVANATASTFTSTTLATGDVVTVTFTSDENRCDPITSNAITMVVATPQVLTGGGNYCATDQFGGVSIQLQSSQVGVTYQLMLGATKVFFPVPGNGGPISFGFHKYQPGTYSVQPSINNVVCSAFGAVTVGHTPARTHTVNIVPPAELISGQSATFTAESTIEDLNPAYRWYVFDFDNPNAGFVLQPQANTKTFVLNPVPQGDIEIRVEVIAPTGVCVDDADAIASDVTGQINPLPVALLYLKATKQANQVVELEWATVLEQNSEGFEVQVSGDAKNYRALGFVAAKAGGNTNQKQVYTFHDKESGKYGTRYYRLLQRDMNGDTEYFGPKAVQFGEATGSLVAYPNPFTNAVNLTYSAEETGTMHVIMTNAIGAKVLERTYTLQKGHNQQTLQLPAGLPLGMYTITTRLNGKTRQLKLLKK